MLNARWAGGRDYLNGRLDASSEAARYPSGRPAWVRLLGSTGRAYAPREGGRRGRVVRDLHGAPPSVFQGQIILGLFRSDIFLLIDNCCADNHRFAVSYDRQISDITDRKKPDPIVQI